MSGTTIWFRFNTGAWLPSGDPAAGTGGIDLSAMDGSTWYPTVQGTGDAGITLNAGATGFTGTVPAGFTAGWPASVGFTTLDPAKVYGSATLGGGNLHAGFPNTPGMAQAVDGKTTGKFYFELVNPTGDIFSGRWGGGVGVDYTAGGNFNFWINDGSFTTGNLDGGALIGGQTLVHALSSLFARGATAAADVFNFAANVGNIAGVAIHIVPAIPPDAAVLNLDNLVVTSLATESPCTVALFTTPPSVSPSVGLRWSNSRGKTFGPPVAQTFSNNPRSQPQWNRTGYARGRVFELFWSAAMKTALNGAFVDIEPWKS
jgi:hypothetical protein